MKANPAGFRLFVSGAAIMCLAAAVALVIALEVFLAFWIRDNLALNIIMLIASIRAIARWQAAA